MFTGLIKEVGTLKKRTPNQEGVMLCIHAPKLIQEIAIDDSVATNGVCLTAVHIDRENQVFCVQVVHITLEKSSLGSLIPGDSLNLELALRPNDRLGGHFVQGHVNGIGKIVSIENRGKNYWMAINIAKELTRYCLDEGSIAIEGISLTLAKVEETLLYVSLIPHTWEQTNLQYKKPGDSVNIEVDMLAKYLEKLLLGSEHKNNKLLGMLKEW